MPAHTRPSRRDFVKTAGAALAVPYVITSSALGNDERPPASDRIVMGGVTRGCIVGVAVWAAMNGFVRLMPLHPLAALASLLLASTMLSLLGLLAALWAEKFDQMAAVTNFVVTPMSFLSGTFYTIHDLPGVFHALALANPFFYMIDGIRFALTGHSDGSVALGALVLLAVNLGLWVWAYRLMRRGYKLKA